MFELLEENLSQFKETNLKAEFANLNSTNPMQDLWMFVRGPFQFARALVKDSWIEDSNWLLFKGFFLLILVTALLHLAQWPAESAAWGATALEISEYLRSLSQSGKLPPSFFFSGGAEVAQALASPESTGLFIWILSLLRGLGFLVFPIAAAISAVLLSALAFLYLRVWKQVHRLSFQRVLILFCYAHCWLLLGLVFSSPWFLLLLGLGVFVFWTHCLIKAVKDFSLPGTRPGFFGLFSFLLFARTVIFLFGLPLA